MSKKSFFSKCPRCRSQAFETLSSYAHCVECLYTEDYHVNTETAYLAAMRVIREIEIGQVIPFPTKTKKSEGAAS